MNENVALKTAIVPKASKDSQDGAYYLVVIQSTIRLGPGDRVWMTMRQGNKVLTKDDHFYELQETFGQFFSNFTERSSRVS